MIDIFSSEMEYVVTETALCCATSKDGNSSANKASFTNGSEHPIVESFVTSRRLLETSEV